MNATRFPPTTATHHMKDNMSLETTAAGGALIKIFGVPVLAGAAATALAFLFMWPRTLKEAFVRLAATILASAIAGPLLVIAVHSWWPTLVQSAGQVAVLYGSSAELGFLFIAAPFMVMAGLPAWWLMGAVVLWLDKRRGKDIGEIAREAAEVVHDVRGAL
jgi:nicotinamidase-related amidase